MAFLGLDFIISSLIWMIVIFVSVILFRKQIKKFFYKEVSFDIFNNNLIIYLNDTYPSIVFDFLIMQTSQSEPNPNTRKYLIVDNIITQYMKLELNKNNYPSGTEQSLQWGSYIFNSEPNKNKLPSDWVQRKNALLTRDHQKCFRCSKSININLTQIHMIRSLENGGKYFLENLIPVCYDCKKILDKDTKKLKHLDIKENLYDFVKGRS
jgi:hypothetical protein